MSGEAGAMLDGEYFSLFVGSGVSVSPAVEPGRNSVAEYFDRANAPFLVWVARAKPGLEALFAELGPKLALVPRAKWRGEPNVITSYELLGHHRTLRLRVQAPSSVGRQRLDQVTARVAAVLRLIEPGRQAQVEVASRFDEVSPRSLVHLDEQGNVALPSRALLLRWRALRTGVVWAPLAGVASMVALGVGAWPLLVAGSVAGGWMNLRAAHWLDVGWAQVRHKQGRLDEAERIARTLLASSLAARKHKLAAAAVLVAVALERGEHEQALAHLAEARRWWRGPSTPAWETIDLSEAYALAVVGRVTEARARLAPRLARVPDGDYLRYYQWLVELHVCFCEGAHALAHDELDRRAPLLAAPIARTSGPALLAWAYAQLGDLDRARPQLFEAFNRVDATFEKRAPRLWAWMHEHAHWATPDLRR